MPLHTYSKNSILKTICTFTESHVMLATLLWYLCLSFQQNTAKIDFWIVSDFCQKIAFRFLNIISPHQLKTAQGGEQKWQLG